MKLTFIAIFLSSNLLFAQKELDKVAYINFNNIKAIQDGDEVVGYYMFYKSWIKGLDYNYYLRILDQNAEFVAEKKFRGDNYFSLIETAYNKDVLSVKFYDSKEKKVSIYFFNNKAEKVGSKIYEADKTEHRTLLMAQSKTFISEPTLHPIGNKGFLHYKIVKNKKYGYEISYFPNNKEEKKWKSYSDRNSEQIETTVPLEINEDVIINQVFLKDKMITNEAEFLVNAIDAKTGKELFRTKLANSDFEENAFHSYYDDANQEIYLFGNYFEKGKKVLIDKNIGLVMTVLGLDGSIKRKKYVSWADDVSKILACDENGEFEGIGNVYIHDYVKQSNGKIYAIGEQIGKAKSKVVHKSISLGIPDMKVSKASVGNFYFFEFDSDFKLTDIKTFEKNTSVFELPAGISGMNETVLSYYSKRYDGFGFDYVKELDNGNIFTVYYQAAGDNWDSYYGIISNENGVYTQDKINFDRSYKKTRVLPANGGSILTVDFDSETKKINMNIQKMNY